jgi:hypothetical protein
MAHAHLAYAISRLFTAAVIIGIGLAVLRWPQCYTSVRRYFKRVGELPPSERDRVDRVLAARKEAEDIPAAYGRYLAMTILALGVLGLLPVVPMVLPYALLCLAFAGFTLLAYLRFRRATERRVAPLVRRSALRVFSPVLVAAMICCFIATVGLAAYPPQRVSAIIAVIAMLVLGFVAWRIAEAPALLLGDDPQWEYAVDARVRICRARDVAALACATAVVVVGFAYPSLLAGFHLYGTIALPVVYAAFAVSVVASIGPLYQTLRVA